MQGILSHALIFWLIVLALVPQVSASAVSAAVKIKAFEQAFQNGRESYGTIEERMQLYRVPGVSIAVIENGQLAWAKGYGVKETGTEDRVDTNTVFSVGSVSKVGAATITLRLVEAGLLDLDKDINTLLTRWQVPQNKFTAKTPVTLRHILSHTAGFSVHGFGDFQPGQKLPTTLDTLLGRSPAKHKAVEVLFEPGSYFRYSGGGTTVAQLIVEEKSEMNFEDAANKWLFHPLTMSRSSYENPLPASHGNIAKAHDGGGRLRAKPRGWEAMPEKAASGLWTTPTDLSKMMIALMAAYQGRDTEFLSQALVQNMMSRQANSEFGLGPTIRGETFSHGGSNDSYKALMQGNLANGSGFVILTNSASGRRMIQEIAKVMQQLGLG